MANVIETTRHGGEDVRMRLDELSDDPRPGTFLLRLRELSMDLLKHDYTRDELLEEFEHYREVLRDRGREDLEDDLLDAMDQLAGWCSPHARI